ncbi:NAD(+)/NADH kinase [Candidatus Entotheonella palauensis]|uniref:NAD(+)/NADH kinase n=1 Tax=Candidatus Entotheonella palauensis TaxID=93172 RepID=UPI0015C42AA7|nr:NAD(+)/NADH kinase [Candidatus Entotheonella palauensis]
MQIVRLLVVYKKSYYELYGDESQKRRDGTARQRYASIRQTMECSHEENQQTLTTVCQVLEAANVSYDCIYRGELEPISGYDLILSVGGDGTLLEVSRYAGDTPVLGVNSDPTRSTAFFCAADRATIGERFADLLNDTLELVPLTRLQLAINDQVLPFYALNDLLIAHINPAAMAAYELVIGAECERQKSSGIWLSTAAGSTAGIRAAGGRVLPLHSRQRQCLVREPYVGNGSRYRLLQGIVSPDTVIEVTSRMRRGGVFIDGPHLRYTLGLGDKLSVTLAPTPLRLYGLDPQRQNRF